MGKFSEQLGKRRLRAQDDEPFPNWRAIGRGFALALRIRETAPDKVHAILTEWREAGKFDDVEQLRKCLKLLSESAIYQLKVAEDALQNLDEAIKAAPNKSAIAIYLAHS